MSANLALCRDVTIMLTMPGLAFRGQPLHEVKIHCKCFPAFVIAKFDPSTCKNTRCRVYKFEKCVSELFIPTVLQNSGELIENKKKISDYFSYYPFLHNVRHARIVKRGSDNRDAIAGILRLIWDFVNPVQLWHSALYKTALQTPALTRLCIHSIAPILSVTIF